MGLRTRYEIKISSNLLVGQSRVSCCCSVDCTGNELRRCELLTVDVDDVVDEAVDEGR